ncbi:MAG: ABC transporter substrate-binding protein [Chromatiaceae bacterium]|nr:ABC transporter substrate-binding protein [Chromatiaceae bacterium]
MHGRARRFFVTRPASILARLALALAVLLCSQGARAEPPIRVSLQLPWKHQFEFAGFYAAQALGIYREQGIEVELRDYQPDLDPLATALSGEATFGLTNGQVINWRLRGEPVVLLANYFKKPPLVLLARSGLYRLADLRGARLMAAASDLQSPLLRAALHEAGLVPGENLRILPQTFDAGPLIRGDVDAMTAFVTNDPFDLENKGVPYQLIELGGHVPGLGDGYLFSSATLAREQPQLVRAFVDASRAGWEYALAHPDELVELIHRQYAPNRSRAALRYEAERTRELMQTRLLPIGSVSPARIELTATALLEAGAPGESRHLKGFLPAVLDTDPASPDSASEERPAAPRQAEPPSPALGLDLSAAQRAWLAAHPVLRYTQWSNRAPVEFLDASGTPSGMSADYLARAAEMLGVRLHYVPTASWAEALERLRAGDIDLLPSAAPTNQRRDYLVFTKAYLTLPLAIFAPLEAPFHGDLEGLRGLRVAVVAGTAAEEWLSRDHPHLELLRVADTGAGLLALEQGRAAALIDSLLTTSHLLARDGNTRLRMAGYTPYAYALSMAVRGELAPLAEILDQALISIGPAEREAIEQRWRQPLPITRVDYRLLWQVSGALALVILAILYWNRRLALTQAALQHSKRRFEEMARLIPVGLFSARYLADGRDSLDYLSPRALDLLGLEATNTGMRRMDQLFALAHPEDQPELLRYRQAIIAQQADCQWEGRMLRNGETRWYRLEAMAAPQANGACLWQGIISDITLQKESETALIGARLAAEAANRAKSDFLANMSHEIRTPMNAVLGMLRLCLETPLDGTQRDYLQQAEQAAGRLLALLNDILDLSKVEAGLTHLEERPFALSGVLEDVRLLIAQQAASKGLVLSIESDPRIPPALCGDPMRLTQVLINLASNAVKFTEQGQVEIQVRLERQEAGRLWLRFAVRDTGIGLSEEQIARLFQPFHQADTSISRRYGGTGLGLSISKRLARLMEGDILVSSRPGEGSTFSLLAGLGLAPRDQEPDDRASSGSGAVAPVAASMAPAETADEQQTGNGEREPTPDALRRAAPLLKELSLLAGAFEAATEDYFLAHRHTLAEALSADELTMLAREIHHYRFPEALSLLRQIEERLTESPPPSRP